jgi:hypothetical protein
VASILRALAVASPSWCDQWVEAIFDTLKDQLGLEHHGAHTIQGAWIRVAQRLLALATGVWFNWQLGLPVKRSLIAFDH